ncbi:MAG: sensor domain-containing diguanylate cyclase [Myxococcaceae bacterium]
MKRTVEQLAAVNEIAKALTSTLQLSEVLQLIGQKGSALLGAQSWSLLLQRDDGMLHFEVCVGPGSESLKSLTVLPGEGIAGTVFSTGRSRLVNDVKSDPDFAPRFDEATTLTTQSIVAVPLLVRGNAIGVLELVALPGGKDLFTDEDVRVAQVMAEFAAIAIDNARNFQRVQDLTLTDEHTGLFNARHLLAQLDREVNRCQRFGRPLSLLFLDIDHFKQINDTRGHLVGSRVLKEVGRLLNDTVRTVDSAYRYGGDEFALLLLETGQEGARAAANRVLEAFRMRSFDVGQSEPVRVTVSVGGATYPDHALTALGLLEASDRAMYRAKRGGRNAADVGVE